MLIEGDINLYPMWMLTWQPVTLWYRTLNLDIARLLNSFPFLNILRWVVSGARKSFPGHLHWFFTWDQLGDRQISDVHVRKILPCLLHKTNVIYVTVGLFINRSPEDVIKQLEHQWHTRLRLMCRFFCSYNIMTSSVIYYWTDPRQNGRCVTPRNMTAREILKMYRSM